ncbi:O-antigen ligase family protein [Devosia sp. 919]|uniref:O-antigen ligase family protein n=1 Tax=Devosia sp. 919 TaxID=2726065 RepID=UPI001553B7F2|nr:O-antigen ligase family protein [Devosia sp. 919]
MTLAVHSPRALSLGWQMRLNLAALLSAICLGALQLDPLLGSRAILLFLGCGAVLVLSNVQHNIQGLLRFWLILLLPLYCLASTLWSEAPPDSFRGAIQLWLTVIIAITIAVRVPPRSALRAIFVVMFLTMIASVLFGRVRADIGAWVGIFGSKNAFAAAVSVFLLASLATLGDRAGSALERWSGLAGLLLALPLIGLAQSAGAIIVVVPGAALIMIVQLMRWFAPTHRVVLAAALLMLAAAMSLLIAAYWSEIMQLVLESSGKDVTLTGRTELWTVALDFISQRPWFGMGFRAFWLHGFAPAEALWAQFGIGSRSGFNFHNTYLSNAVEIGIVGVALQVMLLATAFILTLRWSLRAPSAANAFFAGYLTMILCTSMVEVQVFYQFSFQTVVVLLALVYAIRAASQIPRRSPLRYSR